MTDTATKVIALLSTFAGRACLAAAVAIAALTLPLAPANAGFAEKSAPAGASLDFNEEDGTLYIDWSGPIVLGMADYLRSALGKYGTVSHRVVLFLNSAGGQVEEGDRVIQILNETKQTHRLVTQVLDATCAPPCAYPSFFKAMTVLLHGQASGSSMKPPNQEQMARSEHT